jgi:hypothetical protein
MTVPDTSESPPAAPAVVATAAAARSHRSRLRRFSPSMGWPAFWSEILIVFLGVVIALAANEAVQEWTWRNKVNDAETRLKQDVNWLFIWYAEVVITQPCIDAHLEALGRHVLASGDVLEPAPVHQSSNGIRFVVPLPDRPYVFGTWDALGADGTATHFARDRQMHVDGIARAAARARERGWESQRLRGRLQVMRDAIPLDPGVRSTLLSDIHHLRILNEGLALSARQQLDRIAETFGRPDAALAARLDAVFLGGPEPQAAGRLSATAAFCKAQGLPLADWRPVEQP